MKSIQIIAIAFALALTSTSEAQNNTRFGILAGVNFQNLNGTDYEGKKLNNDLIIGFHAGFNALIPLAPQFYLQPGLLFSTKGAQNSEDGFTSKINLNYIELPIHLLYKAPLGGVNIMIGFGPYFGYALSGKTKAEGNGESFERDIEFTNDVSADDSFSKAYLRPLDIGGNIFVGIEMLNGFSVQLNSQLGMFNLNPDDKRIQDDESSLKNTGFGLSVGFRF